MCVIHIPDVCFTDGKLDLFIPTLNLHSKHIVDMELPIYAPIMIRNIQLQSVNNLSTTFAPLRLNLNCTTYSVQQGSMSPDNQDFMSKMKNVRMAAKRSFPNTAITNSYAYNFQQDFIEVTKFDSFKVHLDTALTQYLQSCETRGIPETIRVLYEWVPMIPRHLNVGDFSGNIVEYSFDTRMRGPQFVEILINSEDMLLFTGRIVFQNNYLDFGQRNHLSSDILNDPTSPNAWVRLRRLTELIGMLPETAVVDDTKNNGTSSPCQKARALVIRIF